MMTRNTKARRARKAKGFTLLEILLVVGLLALLAAFALPALIGQGEKAKIKLAEAAVKSNGTISSAIKNYKFDIGRYPDSLQDLVEKPNDDEIADKWTAAYLDVDPKTGFQDPWGKDYVYQAPGDHNEDTFDLYSLGPNGIDGDEDDITNWADS